jgi:hypothetical protein
MSDLPERMRLKDDLWRVISMDDWQAECDIITVRWQARVQAARDGWQGPGPFYPPPKPKAPNPPEELHALRKHGAAMRVERATEERRKRVRAERHYTNRRRAESHSR